MFNLTLVISFLSSDSTPPTFGEPVGLNAKYYRDNHVSFSIPVTENHGGSGLNQVRRGITI